MVMQDTFNRLDHLSFKGNLKNTRYGWLRLTPAYSVHLVAELLDNSVITDPIVLDPFCGTGTTALVCAEKGFVCDTTDINPFLVWLGQTKAKPYSQQQIEAFRAASHIVVESIKDTTAQSQWLPPIHQIEKWWHENTLSALARAMYTIKDLAENLQESTHDLLKIAFCRMMIDQSNASFGHQSMSFKKTQPTLPLIETSEEAIIHIWEQTVSQIAVAAFSPILKTPRFLLCDARNLSTQLEANHYSCVITSPPYPNRMSYIRELRPYMYWLNYLNTGREAGELDWQAIGGTWGIATSNVGRWEPNTNVEIPFENFSTILENISIHSPLLARYVHKYFYDMVSHCRELFRVVREHGTITYIVGNSKFYDVLLPVDAIFAGLFEAAGFHDIDIRIIRKRSSKKELFEYAVSAKKD